MDDDQCTTHLKSNGMLVFWARLSLSALMLAHPGRALDLLYSPPFIVTRETHALLFQYDTSHFGQGGVAHLAFGRYLFD